MEDRRRAARTSDRKERHRNFSNSDGMHTKVLENLPCYDNVQMLMMSGDQVFILGLNYPTFGAGPARSHGERAIYLSDIIRVNP